jgi:arabinoxylan arabinofuranohydrolase
VYADVSRADRPTCLGYATSRSPFGPFTYRGVIIDNDHSDPVAWNNHGSLVEFKGQWYVFYHRPTHGSVAMRKACLEPITFRPDGSIPEVEMTSQGAAGPLNAFAELDAARACLLIGNARIKTSTADNEVLADLRSGDKAAFKYLDFKEGADSVSIRVAPGSKPGKIDLFVDDSWGAAVGSVQVPTKQTEKWVTVKAAVKVPAGTHALWLSFLDPTVTGPFGFPLPNASPEAGELFQVDALRFHAKKR